MTTSLDRFKSAQAGTWAGFEAARQELKAGEKTGHWIWYIFPQLAGLGSSSMSRTYALADVQEAIDYLQDPVLGARLAELTSVVAEKLAEGIPLTRLMGGKIDAVKIVSSLTLFELAWQKLGVGVTAVPHAAEFAKSCQQVLASAEREGFPRCRFTLENAARP
jgi:uncharacterized protein (DUF1810 family)